MNKFKEIKAIRIGIGIMSQVKQEIKDCLSIIDFRSLLKPVLFMTGVYLLGFLTIIRANVLYFDDIGHTAFGYRSWYEWSRYISEILSILIHGDTNMTDISPLPQLLAIVIMAVSSVLLVYIIGNGKINAIRLLASVPLGFSPYFLDCISYKFDAPYMALSILAGIVPFLFMMRKKAFLCCSIVSLLIMCMTYQAASGIYILIVIFLSFQDWNTRKKTDKELLSFLGMATFAFCFAILFFKFFLLVPEYAAHNTYATTNVFPLDDLIPGIMKNIKRYIGNVYLKSGITWKIGYVFVCIFFIAKSILVSERKKTLSFFVSIMALGFSFMLSWGAYLVLIYNFLLPRYLIGFGAFLAIICIYIVSDYKRIASIAVLALNWCLLVFAVSYGNALADQARYTEFRITLLLHDLSSLYLDENVKLMEIQLENSIEYAPSVNNIRKHYPIISGLVPKGLGVANFYDVMYYQVHFNFQCKHGNGTSDFRSLNLPVVLDSYYHTIRSDGNRVLIVLKH